MAEIMSLLNEHRVFPHDVNIVKKLLDYLFFDGIEFEDAKSNPMGPDRVAVVTNWADKGGFSIRYAVSLEEQIHKEGMGGITASMESWHAWLNKGRHNFLLLECLRQDNPSLIFPPAENAFRNPDSYKIILYEGASDVVVRSILSEKGYFVSGTDDPVHDNELTTFVMNPDVGTNYPPVFVAPFLLKNTKTKVSFLRFVRTPTGYVPQEVAIDRTKYNLPGDPDPYRSETIARLSGRYKGVAVKKVDAKTIQEAFPYLNAALRSQQCDTRAMTAIGELTRIINTYDRIFERVELFVREFARS